MYDLLILINLNKVQSIGKGYQHKAEYCFAESDLVCFFHELLIPTGILFQIRI
jgi:hypothetical protein